MTAFLLFLHGLVPKYPQEKKTEIKKKKVCKDRFSGHFNLLILLFC